MTIFAIIAVALCTAMVTLWTAVQIDYLLEDWGVSLPSVWSIHLPATIPDLPSIPDLPTPRTLVQKARVREEGHALPSARLLQQEMEALGFSVVGMTCQWETEALVFGKRDRSLNPWE